MCKLPMCNCCRKMLTMPLAAWIVLVASAGALIFAFCAQYMFDVKACDLCLWQRAPYGVAVVLAALALLARQKESSARLFLGLASLAFFTGVGLAIFHTGVEQYWWADAVSCSIASMKASDVGNLGINEMREKLLATANSVPCDEITWSFLGLSMANWNILASLALALFSGLAACGCCAEGEGGTTCRFCCSGKTK